MTKAEELRKRVKKFEDLLRVPVLVDPEEVDRLIVTRLIAIRNNNKENEKLVVSFDSVLRFWLTDDEFTKYVIMGEPI